MRILDIQNLQLSHNDFYISINNLNLENDVWYIETSINLYFNFSYKVLQQATHNPITNLSSVFVTDNYNFVCYCGSASKNQPKKKYAVNNKFYYCKHQRISRTFLLKIFVSNWGCGLSPRTSGLCRKNE